MAVVDYAVANGKIVSETRGGTHRFYHADALGSTVALYNDSQTKTDWFKYWPYGEIRDSLDVTGTPMKFIGTEGCPTQADGSVYMRAREVDPENGRWMTVDPLWPTESPYCYVQDGPTSKSDPTGLCWCPVKSGSSGRGSGGSLRFDCSCAGALFGIIPEWPVSPKDPPRTSIRCDHWYDADGFVIYLGNGLSPIKVKVTGSTCVTVKCVKVAGRVVFGGWEVCVNLALGYLYPEKCRAPYPSNEIGDPDGGPIPIKLPPPKPYVPPPLYNPKGQRPKMMGGIPIQD